MKTEIKHRPILFSGEMVRAILDGRKTQTRRVVKFKMPVCNHKAFSLADWRDESYQFVQSSSDPGYYYCGLCGNGTQCDNKYRGIKSPYGKPGDVLWVRETWFADWEIGEGCRGEGPDPFFYKATDEHPYAEGYQNWKPSIYMPKDACRLFLKIKSVRVERLHNISEADAMAEGVENFFSDPSIGSDAYRNYMAARKDFEENHWAHVANDAVESFQTLWQKINGLESWDVNPWVWVIEFEKCDKPENF